MSLFFLLFLTGAMLAVSGATKLRATQRTGLQPSILAVAELGLAVVVMLLGAPGPFAGSAIVRWSVPVAFALILGSSVHHGLRIRTYRRNREETEGGRLATYVKFLSERDETQ